MRKALVVSIILAAVVARAGVSDGLVAYYPFNGNANDESGNGHDGTVNGAVLTTDRSGNADSAYDFDGTDQYISIPRTPLLEPESSISVSLWFEANQTDQTARVISKKHGTVSHTVVLYVEDDKLISFVKTSSNGDHPQTGFTDTSSWHHAVVVYDGEFGRLYLDGVEKDKDDMSGAVEWDDSYDWIIGAYVAGGVQPFDGAIDEVRIYNRALGASEVSQLYSGLYDGLVAYYPFNGDADDESGYGRDGTVSGTTTVPGMREQALSFGDNTDDKVSLPAAVAQSLGDFSISSWLAVDSVKYKNHFLSTEDQDFAVYYSSAAYSGWRIVIQGVGYSFPANTAMDDHEWHHVVLMRDGAVGELYVDGARIGTDVSLPTGALAIAAADLVVGQDAEYPDDIDRVWAGRVDELLIHSRALTATEIQQLYDQGLIFGVPALSGFGAVALALLLALGACWRHLRLTPRDAPAPAS